MRKFLVVLLAIVMVVLAAMGPAFAVTGYEDIVGLRINAPPGYCGYDEKSIHNIQIDSNIADQTAYGRVVVFHGSVACVYGGQVLQGSVDQVELEVLLYCEDSIGFTWLGYDSGVLHNTGAGLGTNVSSGNGNWCGSDNGDNPGFPKARTEVISRFELPDGWHQYDTTTHWVDPCTTFGC